MAQNKDHTRSEAELILGLHDVIRAQEKKIHRQQSQISHLNFMVVKLTEDRDRLARLLSRYSSDSRGRKMERTIYSIREDTKKADKIDRDALSEFDMASRTTWYIDLTEKGAQTTEVTTTPKRKKKNQATPSGGGSGGGGEKKGAEKSSTGAVTQGEASPQPSLGSRTLVVSLAEDQIDKQSAINSNITKPSNQPSLENLRNISNSGPATPPNSPATFQNKETPINTCIADQIQEIPAQSYDNLVEDSLDSFDRATPRRRSTRSPLRREKSFKQRRQEERIIQRSRTLSNPYELSVELYSKQVEMLEKSYGGRDKAHKAAQVIQSAYRQYGMNKQFQRLRRSQSENRSSRLLSSLRSSKGWEQFSNRARIVMLEDPVNINDLGLKTPTPESLDLDVFDREYTDHSKTNLVKVQSLDGKSGNSNINVSNKSEFDGTDVKRSVQRMVVTVMMKKETRKTEIIKTETMHKRAQSVGTLEQLPVEYPSSAKLSTIPPSIGEVGSMASILPTPQDSQKAFHSHIQRTTGLADLSKGVDSTDSMPMQMKNKAKMMTLGNGQKASVGKIGHLPTKVSSSKQPVYDPLTSRTTPTNKDVVLMPKTKNSKLSDKTTRAELIIKPEQMAPSGSESSLDSLRKRDSSSSGVYSDYSTTTSESSLQKTEIQESSEVVEMSAKDKLKIKHEKSYSLPENIILDTSGNKLSPEGVDPKKSKKRKGSKKKEKKTKDDLKKGNVSAFEDMSIEGDKLKGPFKRWRSRSAERRPRKLDIDNHHRWHISRESSTDVYSRAFNLEFGLQGRNYSSTLPRRSANKLIREPCYNDDIAYYSTMPARSERTRSNTEGDLDYDLDVTLTRGGKRRTHTIDYGELDRISLASTASSDFGDFERDTFLPTSSPKAPAVVLSTSDNTMSHDSDSDSDISDTEDLCHDETLKAEDCPELHVDMRELTHPIHVQDFQMSPSPVWKRKHTKLANGSLNLHKSDTRESVSSESSGSSKLTVGDDSSVTTGSIDSLREMPVIEPIPPSMAIPNTPPRRRKYRIGLNLFNKKPEKGIKFLIENKFLENSTHEVAKFLLSRIGLSKQKIGEYLGDLQQQFNMMVLECYVEEINFQGLTIDNALRKFQSYFRMPGEAQKIERLVEAFSQRYLVCNPEIASTFNNPDTVFILAFAIIMLHTDLHSPNVKNERKMKLDDFVKNLRGIDDGQDIAKELLHGVYERIKKEEFHPATDHVTAVQSVEQSILGNRPILSQAHRRLVCSVSLLEINDPSKREKKHFREIFLFNDMLVVTKLLARKKTGTLYNFKKSFPLHGITVLKYETPFYPYGIRLISVVDNKVLATFCALNHEDWSRFVRDLQEYVMEMNEMEDIRIGAMLQRASMKLNWKDKN
ncbi:IQ motif and SEC7 domain-containing protein 2-like isoform X2 [Anneissia japonica]|uniref:IQ motif and SEC7 domain-containing protein 2-like isoform X2 n=1 Tax=Anneissia japonica TaxID=1529436 RepID=UPI001425A96F|nr:IQ motif and SEC7 domain-containing protein 2-like isoform X2 [Anneissia japonica]